jgi:hypothetical protein
VDDSGSPAIAVEIEDHGFVVHEFWAPERTIVISDNMKKAP